MDMEFLEDSSFWVPRLEALWLDPVDELLFPEEWRCLFGRISVFLNEAGIEEWAGKLRLPGVIEWLWVVTGGVDPKECRFLFDGGSLGDEGWEEDKEMELEDRWFRNVTDGSWFVVEPAAWDEECLVLLLPLKNKQKSFNSNHKNMYRSSKSHPSWFATKINEPYYIETQDTGTQCLCLNPTYHPIIPLYNHYPAPSNTK